jgi:hypothetical protein
MVMFATLTGSSVFGSQSSECAAHHLSERPLRQRLSANADNSAVADALGIRQLKLGQ